jgi:2-polyprenyl-6-methoxyphenol hydroxylase-like FAD-dependent oxidoreductase
MAIEDGLCLADCIAGANGDFPAAFRRYESAYRNAHPTMKALLSMLDLGRRQAVGDRDPIRHWHKGRVVLLSDAAHPTLQSLAQGVS